MSDVGNPDDQDKSCREVFLKLGDRINLLCTNSIHEITESLTEGCTDQ